MIVNSPRLFLQLLSSLRIDLVADVGSMNGADALAFRKTLPSAVIYAFEPNPRNAALMISNDALKRGNVNVVPMAASNLNGRADFYLVEADYSRPEFRRGMSSLYARTAQWAPVDVVSVQTTRLDTYFTDKNRAGARIALWIDTEGKAYEVLEGISEIADRVQLLHVEVETAPLISPGQKLHSDVRALLAKFGFVEIGTDQSQRMVQFNALYVRSGLSGGWWIKTRFLQWRAVVRYLLVKAIVTLCPACNRRYQAMRRK
jgi:FkbM family methyltransferase